MKICRLFLSLFLMTSSALLPREFIELDQEYTIESVPVQGEVPAWIDGSFIRNGPSKFTHMGHKVPH